MFYGLTHVCERMLLSVSPQSERCAEVVHVASPAAAIDDDLVTSPQR